MKRPSLGSTVARSTEAVAAAAATARALTGAKPVPVANGEAVTMTTSTIHIPAELLNALRGAANRRSMRRISGTLDDGRSTRPSVSEIVVEMLGRHRAELDTLE